MTLNQKNIWTTLLLAGVTVMTGFLTWWSFVFISFTAAFWLTRKRNPRAYAIAVAAPVGAWLLTALVRDVSEGGRISAKLATLLHVQIAFAVYAVIGLIVAIPSALAAFSGARFAESFR